MTSVISDKQGLMSSKEAEAVQNAYIVDQQLQPSGVLVTEPVMVPDTPPETQRGLILSILSTIFCGPCFGAVATLLAWKARLMVLERKFAQARHTMTLTWVFLGFAVLFGIFVWFYLIYEVSERGWYQFL